MNNDNLGEKPRTDELESLNAEKETKPADIEQETFQFLGDPTAQNTAALKPKTKLKKFMPLIILGICAVVLISAVLVLNAIHGGDDITETGGEDETISIFNFTGTTAERLEIKNQLDSYAFVRKLEKTYYIEGYENNAVNNSSILSLLTYFGSLEAVTEVAADVTDFDQYGLEEPVSTVTWIKGDTKHTLEIGNIAASGNYYARVDGEAKVYTVSSDIATLYLSPRMDFYNPYIYDFDQETDANYINYFEFTQRGKDTIKIRLQDLTDDSIESAYVIEEPIEHNVSIEKANSFTDLVSALTSCTVYSDDVSEEGLKSYGLTDPAIKYSFVNVAERHDFRFSDPTDKGYVYMYVEGGSFIYIVDEDDIEILTYNLADYCESMAYNRSYDTIDSIVITGQGKRYEINITGNAEDSDLMAYINGKAVEYENFSDLYVHILGIEVKDIQDDLKTDDLLVTVKVECKDGTTETLEYFKQTDLDSYYRLNGEGMIVVSTAKVEQILEFAQKLYDGEEIVTEW